VDAPWGRPDRAQRQPFEPRPPASLCAPATSRQCHAARNGEAEAPCGTPGPAAAPLSSPRRGRGPQPWGALV